MRSGDFFWSRIMTQDEMKKRIAMQILKNPEILDELAARIESDDIVAWDNCYFFGSFDPIHNEHISMALKAKKCGYNVILVPAYKPPHKQPTSFTTRLEMCNMAARYNNLIVSDIEWKLPEPTYTINTLRALIPDFDTINCRTSFIAGTDTIDAIKDWYQGDILLQKLDIIPFSRTGISSTDIRKLIKEGKSISHLVPKYIDEYIRAEKLYM